MGRESPIERVPLGLIDKLSMVHEVLLPGLGENALLRLEGTLDAEVLARAFLAVFRQFPICRARIVAQGWRYFFDISHAGGPPARHEVWSYEDLSREDARHAIDRERRREFVNQPLRIMEGPQVRALLIRLSEGEHRLCLKMSHTVFDGTSAMLLLSAVASNYTRMLADPTYDPPEGSLLPRNLSRLLRNIPGEAASRWIREGLKTCRARRPAGGRSATPYVIQDITGYNPKNRNVRIGFEVLRLGKTEIEIIERAAATLDAKSVEVFVGCILRAFYLYNDRRGVSHGVYKVAIPIDLRPLAGLHMEPGNLSSSISMEIPAQAFSSLPGLVSFFRKTLEEKKQQGQAITSLARYAALAPFARWIIWWYRHRKPPPQPLFLDTMPLSYSGRLDKYLFPLGDARITDIVAIFQLVPVLAFFENHISFTFPFIDDGRLSREDLQGFFEAIQGEIQSLEATGSKPHRQAEVKITK